MGTDNLFILFTPGVGEVSALQLLVFAFVWILATILVGFIFYVIAGRKEKDEVGMIIINRR